MTLHREEATANSVPAAAVIRRWHAYFFIAELFHFLAQLEVLVLDPDQLLLKRVDLGLHAQDGFIGGHCAALETPRLNSGAAGDTDDKQQHNAQR